MLTRPAESSTINAFFQNRRRKPSREGEMQASGVRVLIAAEALPQARSRRLLPTAAALFGHLAQSRTASVLMTLSSASRRLRLRAAVPTLGRRRRTVGSIPPLRKGFQCRAIASR